MEYRINHVHIRAADPHATAAWYEKHFNARIVSEREVMPRTITIGMEMAGGVSAERFFEAAGIVRRARRCRTEPAGSGALRVRRGRY